MGYYRRGFDVAAAIAHLRRVDRRFAMWLQRLPPLETPNGWREPFHPVDALARAILYQQLSGKAAATIVARVETAIGAKRIHHGTLANIDDARLRICGVSGNKTRALRDLIAREARGEIPTVQRMARMRPEQIIEALIPVRGIGRWTVEMMLIFRLGRPDVLPVDDLGIRKGAQFLDGIETIYSPQTLLERGMCWQPFRSLASLYLWRIADLGAGKGEVTRRSQD